MTLQEILESVKSGSVSVEEAERILKKESQEKYQQKKQKVILRESRLKKWDMRSWIQAARQEPVSQK